MCHITQDSSLRTLVAHLQEVYGRLQIIVAVVMPLSGHVDRVLLVCQAVGEGLAGLVDVMKVMVMQMWG